MQIVNSLKSYAKDSMDLDTQFILQSSPVVTYKLSKEEMDKEFNKYDSRHKVKNNKSKRPNFLSLSW